MGSFNDVLDGLLQERKLQKVGWALLYLALVLAWFKEPLFGWLVLGVILGLDLYLVLVIQARTISQYVQRKWNAPTDRLLLIILVVVTIAINMIPRIASKTCDMASLIGLYCTIFAVKGHLHWND